MDPLNKYYGNISVLGNNNNKDKLLSALEDVEKQLMFEFSDKNGDVSLSKKTEASVFNNISNVDNLIKVLLNLLETLNETTENILRVLCIACKHLLKKLRSELLNRISATCSFLGEKAIAEKNWSVLERCFKCLKIFEVREWTEILSDEQRKRNCFKIIQSTVSLGKEELCDRNKQDFLTLQILCVEVFNNIIKTPSCKQDAFYKPEDWFMSLFPLLFDENTDLRKIVRHTFRTLKTLCSGGSYRRMGTWPNLKEQIKISYSKTLIQFARTNQIDWVDLWCLMFDILGDEFSSKRNTDLINNLLTVEETAFRSTNMTTRYLAFVGWKFLVNKFLDTSMDDASRRLKLLMQPLVASNSKTPEICAIKFEVWWDLIVGIEPCIEKHATNVFRHFLNFCFGPFNDTSPTSVRSGAPASVSSQLAARRSFSSPALSNYPVSSRQMKGLDINRCDALAQILNLSSEASKSEYKLKRFKGPVIAQPSTFLSISKVLIHSAGECTIVIVNSKDTSPQEKRFYLKEIWRNLMLHIKRVDRMPHSTVNEAQDANEKHEKTEMMKNLFRVLLKLNELSFTCPSLSHVCLGPLLETVLSPENGLTDDVLTSRIYYVGTEDIIKGTPLFIMLDMLLSPTSLKHQNVTYMSFLQRILRLGIGPPDVTIPFTQAVLKRLDAVVSAMSNEGQIIGSIWMKVAKMLTTGYVGLGRDINQGSEEQADFSCLFTVLMFPVTHSKTFLQDQEVILKTWGQLFQAFHKNVFSSTCSDMGYELCGMWCGKVQQEILRKKNIQSEELLHILPLVVSAIQYLPLKDKVSNTPKEDPLEKLSAPLQCSRLLQTLNAEIQKVSEADPTYYPIVTHYAKCFLKLYRHFLYCPVNYGLEFLVEAMQGLLSVKSKENSRSFITFCNTLDEVLEEFLNVLVKSLIFNKSDKPAIVKMITPVFQAAFAHSDHAIHDAALQFCKLEKLVDEIFCTEEACSCASHKRARNVTENTSNTFAEPLSRSAEPPSRSAEPPSRSNVEKKKTFFQDYLKRPLTKHQRETFKKRRDDIPALYQDLTQDSQPTSSDLSQDISQLPETGPDNKADDRSNMLGESISFQSVFKSLKAGASPDSSTQSISTEKSANMCKDMPGRCADVSKSVPGQCADTPKSVLNKSANVPESIPSKSADILKVGPSKSEDIPKALPSKSADMLKAGPSKSEDIPKALPSKSADMLKGGPNKSADILKAGPNKSADILKAGPRKSAGTSEAVPSKSSDIQKDVPSKSVDIPKAVSSKSADIHKAVPTKTADISKDVPSKSTGIPKSVHDKCADIPKSVRDKPADITNSVHDKSADVPKSLHMESADMPKPAHDKSADVSSSVSDKGADTLNSGLDNCEDIVKAKSAPDKCADTPKPVPEKCADKLKSTPVKYTDIPKSGPEKRADKLEFEQDETPPSNSKTTRQSAPSYSSEMLLKTCSTTDGRMEADADAGNKTLRRKTIVITCSTNNTPNTSVKKTSSNLNERDRSTEFKQTDHLYASTLPAAIKFNRNKSDIPRKCGAAPIRMCISKLKTGKPEVKHIITDTTCDIAEKENKQKRSRHSATVPADSVLEGKRVLPTVLKSGENGEETTKIAAQRDHFKRSHPTGSSEDTSKQVKKSSKSNSLSRNVDNDTDTASKRTEVANTTTDDEIKREFKNSPESGSSEETLKQVKRSSKINSLSRNADNDTDAASKRTEVTNMTTNAEIKKELKSSPKSGSSEETSKQVKKSSKSNSLSRNADNDTDAASKRTEVTNTTTNDEIKKELKSSPKSGNEQMSPRGTRLRSERSSPKEKEKGVSAMTSDSDLIASLSNIVKKLEAKELDNSICRALKFNDTSVSKEGESSMKQSPELDQDKRKTDVFEFRDDFLTENMSHSQEKTRLKSLNKDKRFQAQLPSSVQNTAQEKKIPSTVNQHETGQNLRSRDRDAGSPDLAHVGTLLQIKCPTIPFISEDKLETDKNQGMHMGKRDENDDVATASDGAFITEDTVNYKGEVSKISCDKGEYIRQLSLMPQTGTILGEAKAHKISTRSDWARRFGGSSKPDIAEREMERDSEMPYSVENERKRSDICSSPDSTGDSDSLDFTDVIDSSQELKGTSFLAVKKGCFVKVPKLDLTPGSVLNGAEGLLMITEKISPVSYRVSNKNDSTEDINNTENVENCTITPTRNTEKEHCKMDIEEQLDREDEALSLIQESVSEHVQSLVKQLCEDLPVPDKQEVPVQDVEKVSESELLNELTDVGGAISENDVKSDEQLLKTEEANMVEDAQTEKEVRKDRAIMELEVPQFATKDDETDVLAKKKSSGRKKKKNKKKLEKMGETEAKRRRIHESMAGEEHCNSSDVSAECSSSKKYIKMEHIEDMDTVKESPPKIQSSIMTTGSPSKKKAWRAKNLQKQEDPTGSASLPSGRAAQLVGLALTKNQVDSPHGTHSTSAESNSEEEGEADPSVYNVNAAGDEEPCTNWTVHVPRLDLTPSRTNLKRKRSDDEDEDIGSPPRSKKCVRFAEQPVTQKAYFPKIESEKHREKKNTYRIVRTKKGKVYVQKNVSKTRERQHHVGEPPESKSIWPSLSTCNSPVSEVANQLVDMPESLDILLSVFNEKNVFTVGDLCSLSEGDISEMPIKTPKVIIFKCVMKAYEDKLGSHIDDSNRLSPSSQEMPIGHTVNSLHNGVRTQLTSMNPADVITLLKETMSESNFKKVVESLQETPTPSSVQSVGVNTECLTQDRSSSTEEAVLENMQHYLLEAFKKQQSDDERTVVDSVFKILLKHVDISCILKELREVSSDTSAEKNHSESGPSNHIKESLKLLQFLSDRSALNEDVTSQLYNDVLNYVVKRAGTSRTLSELSKCIDEGSGGSAADGCELANLIMKTTCGEGEAVDAIFQKLVNKENACGAVEHIPSEQLFLELVKQRGQAVFNYALKALGMNFASAMEEIKKHFSESSEDKKTLLKAVVTSFFGDMSKKDVTLTLFSAIGDNLE